MTDHAAPSTFRLILWPSIVTLLISVARLVAEVKGWITSASGGGGAWLGISWLGFLFGIWFGHKLARSGSAPRLSRGWAWSLLSMLVVIAVAMWRFSGIDRADASEAARAPLREAVLIIAAVTAVMGLLQFAIWPRLAMVLLAYAIPARLTVLALTWLAKSQGWDTHYTKLGPAGIEVDPVTTLQSTSIAQLGFWVPFTMVTGTFCGCIWSGRAAKKSA